MPKQNLASILFAFAVGGCAFDVIHVDHTPAQLDAGADCGAPFTLADDVLVTPSGGYDRTLKQDTAWECVGELTQGAVYRTRDQVLTIEASNVFEANIVVSNGQLAGFYLPVERAFSPLSSPVPLPMQPRLSTQR